MAVRSEFPFPVRKEDPVFIPVGGGVRLAGTLWRPDTTERVPAVLEAVPYRRRDGTVFRDEEIQPYLAGHGIAALRIDIRGSGDSGGVLEDEYSGQEQEDALAVIAWLAAQPWCSGSVGMTGISWGGFAALQTAALRPPALKAIIALCCSDDRYADDVHYMGGCLLTEDPLWSAFMLANNALPPDPQSVGADWRVMWHYRLDKLRSLSATWLRHQRRDEYWRAGSVCEDWSRIRCPIYAIGGWEDSYTNAVPRLLAGLTVPRKGLIGPWSHSYPCRGSPGPNIGYLQEALRWWRQWLKGEDTGIMAEPMLRAWMMEPERPRPFYAEHPGRWVAEDACPSPRIQPWVLHLNERRLGDAAVPGPELSVRSPMTAGNDCGRWGGYGGTCPDMAIDQRREDGLALSFDSEPLPDDLELLGAPRLELELAVDRPVALLAARLCAVDPDGTSALLTYGVLNLTHRESHAHPAPLEPGRKYWVELLLNDLGRRLRAGQRLRLSLATQHWPILWPSPELATLNITAGRSTLILPVRPPRPEDEGLTPFGPAETAPSVPMTELRPGGHSRTVEDDVGTGLRRITLVTDYGRQMLKDRGITVESRSEERFSAVAEDALSAKVEGRWTIAVQSGDASVEVRSETELTGDAGHLYLAWRVEAREAGRLVKALAGAERIERDHL
jgi:putative CocE/NonD family hydrolase